MRATSLLVVLALCPAATAAEKPEPKYEGKPLGFWIEKFQKAETDKDQAVAEGAVIAFGPDAAPAVPLLVEMLHDRSRSYRNRVANMLCAVGPAAKGAVPDLIKMLEEKSPRDPHQVIRVLCAIGPDAKAAIPAIRRVVLGYLTSKDEPAVDLWRYNAFNYYDFANLGPAAVPMLLDTIDLFDTWPGGLSEIAVVNCFGSLRELGPAAKEAAPRLTQLLKHEAPQFRLEAARTLWKVEKDPAVVPVLVAIVKGDDHMLARKAAEALGEIGPAAKDALPALKALLPKEEPARVIPGFAPAPDTSLWELRPTARDAIRKIEQNPKK